MSSVTIYSAQIGNSIIEARWNKGAAYTAAIYAETASGLADTVIETFHNDREAAIQEAKAMHLALAFVANIEGDLMADELQEVKRRNATPDYAAACATHDFRDANMNMQAAYVATFGANPLDDMESANPIWNRAWEIAKAEYLTAK